MKIFISLFPYFLGSCIFLISSGLSAQTNIALNKAAKQSSVNTWDTGSDGIKHGGPGTKATDGKTTGSLWSEEIVETKSNDDNSWWEVDLGDYYAIDKIIVYTRTDCCQDMMKNIWVIVTDHKMPDKGIADETQINWSSNYQTFNANVIKPSKEFIAGGGIGKWVRIQQKGWGSLELAEVEVFGTKRSGHVPNSAKAWDKKNPAGIAFDPSKGDQNLIGMSGEYHSTQKTSPKIISHSNGDGSFDVVWQDMTRNSKKIIISRYAKSGSNYTKDASKSKKMDGLGFLAGFTKSGNDRYIMTGEPWPGRDDKRNAKVYKNDQVLWNAKKNKGGDKINALLHNGSARMAIGKNKLMISFNTGPAHPYHVILDAVSPGLNSSRSAYETLWHHNMDNEVFFDGNDFVIMEKRDHDIGIGMLKLNPSEMAPFKDHAGRLRSVYAHTNFGNGTFLEFGDIAPGLNGGYLLLFASERDWNDKMLGYVHNQPWAPYPMSPYDIALVHVKKDFDKEEANWKNSAGTGLSQAPKRVDNSKMVNSNGSGKTVTYPSANDGWDWNNYNCCGVRDEIKNGMTHREQVTSGVKWITNFGVPFETAARKGNKGEQFTTVRFPKMVKISTNQYIGIWEEHKAEIGRIDVSYTTTKAVKITISASGSKVNISPGTIKDLGKVRLMPDDDAFELGGKAAWVIGNWDAFNLKLYTIDSNLNLSEFPLNP